MTPVAGRSSVESDDWEENLGYYSNFYEPAPTDPDVVLAICRDNFDERRPWVLDW